MKLKLNKN